MSRRATRARALDEATRHFSETIRAAMAEPPPPSTWDQRIAAWWWRNLARPVAWCLLVGGLASAAHIGWDLAR